jgi:hypothetical protein
MISILNALPNQLLLGFSSVEEKEEFERWISMMVTLKATANLTISSNPLSTVEPTTLLRHAVPNDQRLSQLEQQREGVLREKWQRDQREKKNREGLLPWETRKGESRPVPKKDKRRDSF